MLRKAQRIRDAGIGDGSNVLVAIRGDGESDSVSSGPPGMESSDNETHDCALSTNQTHESDSESDSDDIIDELVRMLELRKSARLLVEAAC